MGDREPRRSGSTALRGGAACAPSAAEHGLPAEPIIIEEREIEQTNIRLAVQGPARRDPDRYALALLHTVLGRGMSSRLFQEVRERRGLAYSVASGVAQHQDIGSFIVSAGVSRDQQEEALQVIVAELRRAADEPVSDEELQRAKDFAAGTFRLSMETPMALGQHFGSQLLQDGEIELPGDTVERVRAVEAGDVQAVAQRLFGGDYALAVVGPSASGGSPRGDPRGLSRPPMNAPRTNLILLPGAPVTASRADAVTTSPDASAAARAASAPVHVRLAHPREGLLRQQLEAIDGPVACVLLASVVQPQDLRATDVELRRHELHAGLTPGSIGLIPEIGSAAAIERLPQLLAAVDRIASVGLDIEAVAADLGAPDARAEAMQSPVLARVALAVSAAGLCPGPSERWASRPATARGSRRAPTRWAPAAPTCWPSPRVAGLNALFAGAA